MQSACCLDLENIMLLFAANMEKQNTCLELQNYIGGKFVPSRSFIDSYDPSTGGVFCRVPDSDHEEVRSGIISCAGLSYTFIYPSDAGGLMN